MEEKPNNWKTLAIVVIVLLLLSCCCCLFLGFLNFRGEFTSANQQENVEQYTYCGYSPLMDGLSNPDEGITLSKKTLVTGPAIVQTSSSKIILVHPDKTYTANAGNKVWIYRGNLDCLNSQLEFFEGKSITRIK